MQQDVPSGTAVVFSLAGIAESVANMCARARRCIRRRLQTASGEKMAVKRYSHGNRPWIIGARMQLLDGKPAGGDRAVAPRPAAAASAQARAPAAATTQQGTTRRGRRRITTAVDAIITVLTYEWPS